MTKTSSLKKRAYRHYECEKILARKIHHKTGNEMFLIKWLNYNNRHNSWVNREDLSCDNLLKQFFHHQNKDSTMKDTSLRAIPIVLSTTSVLADRVKSATRPHGGFGTPGKDPVGTNVVQRDRAVVGDVYEVEKILDVKYNKRSRQNMFLIKWSGYGSEENSWVKQEDVFDKEMIDNFLDGTDDNSTRHQPPFASAVIKNERAYQKENKVGVVRARTRTERRLQVWYFTYHFNRLNIAHAVQRTNDDDAIIQDCLNDQLMIDRVLSRITLNSKARLHKIQSVENPLNVHHVLSSTFLVYIEKSDDYMRLENIMHRREIVLVHRIKKSNRFVIAGRRRRYFIIMTKMAAMKWSLLECLVEYKHLVGNVFFGFFY